MTQTTSSDDFETLWQQSLRLPAHKEISVEKIKIELTITDLMDRYLDFIDQAVKQRQMKQDVYERLLAQTTGYKEVLSHINDNIIQRLVKTRRKRQR